jgi:regulator of RNase E activity RraA
MAPGTVNGPISIDGMPISPGDIIIGDMDGVVSFHGLSPIPSWKIASPSRAREEHTGRDCRRQLGSQLGRRNTAIARLRRRLMPQRHGVR